MKFSRSTVLGALLALNGAMAFPLDKRAIKYVTVTKDVVEVVSVTSTVWVPHDYYATQTPQSASIAANTPTTSPEIYSTSVPVPTTSISTLAQPTSTTDSSTSTTESSTSTTESSTSTTETSTSTTETSTSTTESSTSTQSSTTLEYTSSSTEVPTTSIAPTTSLVPTTSIEIPTTTSVIPVTTPTPEPTTYAPSTTIPQTTAVQVLSVAVSTPSVSVSSVSTSVDISVSFPNSGDATFYTPGTGSCGLYSTDSSMIVAISSVLMNAASTGNPNDNPLCGKQIEATVDGVNFITVTVVDTCPECSEYSIDFSPTAFQAMGLQLGQGRVNFHWKWAS
ncbi:hypothetical protein RUND412_002689 [Rhizina undulata]